MEINNEIGLINKYIGIQIKNVHFNTMEYCITNNRIYVHYNIRIWICKCV